MHCIKLFFVRLSTFITFFEFSVKVFTKMHSYDVIFDLPQPLISRRFILLKSQSLADESLKSLKNINSCKFIHGPKPSREDAHLHDKEARICILSLLQGRMSRSFSRFSSLEVHWSLNFIVPSLKVLRPVLTLKTKYCTRTPNASTPLLACVSSASCFCFSADCWSTSCWSICCCILLPFALLLFLLTILLLLLFSGSFNLAFGETLSASRMMVPFRLVFGGGVAGFDEWFERIDDRGLAFRGACPTKRLWSAMKKLNGFVSCCCFNVHRNFSDQVTLDSTNSEFSLIRDWTLEEKGQIKEKLSLFEKNVATQTDGN